MVTNICFWDGGVCKNSSCHTLSPTGFVELCVRHRNPQGRFQRKKVV